MREEKDFPTEMHSIPPYHSEDIHIKMIINSWKYTWGYFFSYPFDIFWYVLYGNQQEK